VGDSPVRREVIWPTCNPTTVTNAQVGRGGAPVRARPSSSMMNQTIFGCLLQGFENGLNLQSRESSRMEQRLLWREQPQHAHVWRGCRTRATTECNWCGTTNIVTSTFRPVSVPVPVAAESAAVLALPLQRLSCCCLHLTHALDSCVHVAVPNGHVGHFGFLTHSPRSGWHLAHACNLPLQVTIMKGQV